MSILKDKYVTYFLEKRLYLYERELAIQKKQEVLNDENAKASVNLDKYHTITVVGVLLYIVLAFALLR